MQISQRAFACVITFYKKLGYRKLIPEGLNMGKNHKTLTDSSQRDDLFFATDSVTSYL